MRIHQADILVTEALSAELDARFVLMPMPAEFVKGIAEPVVTYAVREDPSAAESRRPIVRVKRDVSKFRTNSYSECLLIQTLRNVLFSKFQALVLAYGLLQCRDQSVSQGMALKTGIKIEWFHEKNIFRGPTFTNNIAVCIDSAWSACR